MKNAAALSRQPVSGPCPVAPEGKLTHALMTARELSRFRGSLVYWCSNCRVAHRARSPELRLGLGDPSVASGPKTAQIVTSPA